MERTLIQRLHNPHALVCACDPDCFCNRTAIGRAIKWRVHPRFLSRIGIHHKNRELEEWKRTHGDDALRDWKQSRAQDSPS
jgi:hypothetical protein